MGIRDRLIALNEQAKAEGIRLMAYSMELTGQRFLQLTNIASAQFLHLSLIHISLRAKARAAAQHGDFQHQDPSR